MNAYRRKVIDVQDERRKHPRLDFDCPVVIPGVEGPKKVTDLSCGGVFIELQSSTALRIGQMLNLVFKLPTRKDSLRVKAQVKNLSKGALAASSSIPAPPSCKPSAITLTRSKIRCCCDSSNSDDIRCLAFATTDSAPAPVLPSVAILIESTAGRPW